jgi:galactarate dehydratase
MSNVQTKAAIEPLYIRLHADDNVAIVVNDFGLPTGANSAVG